MNAPAKKPKPPPNLVTALRRDAVNGKVPNMPRLMYRGTLNAMLDKCDWTTGHNVFISKATIGKGWTGADEQKTGRDQKYLREGGWISEQVGPDPDDPTKMVPKPDTDQARLAYYGDGTEEHPGLRGDRRPKIYRINFPVFYAVPRPITGSQFDTPSDEITGYQFDIPTGYQNGAHGVSLEPPNLPIPSSETSSLHQVTDSDKYQSLSKEPNPPSREAGGLGLSGTPSTLSLAPGEADDSDSFQGPTQIEIRRAVHEALRIMDQTPSQFTPYADRARVALTTLTENGDTCLLCALLVPYWVADNEDALKGLNIRTNLVHLWGPQHGQFIADALKSTAPRAGADCFERADAAIFKDSTREADWKLIREICSTCTRRRIAADPRKEERRRDAREDRGLPGW